MRILPAAAALAAAACLAAAAAPPATSPLLSELERRGRQIYLTGTSPSGRELSATLAGSSLPIPGSVLRCASCHGFDGRGRTEGGVVPPDITWEALTKPYGRTAASGRTSPAYDEASLSQALLAGVDPAGNALGTAMPRFALDGSDLAALVAYLRRLGTVPDPGVSATEISIGSVIETAGPTAEAYRAYRDVLSAYFDDVNRNGGVYGRRLRLRELEAAGASVSQDVLAWLAPAAAAPNFDLGALCEAGGIPCIAPLRSSPGDGATPTRYTFSLFSGADVEVRALVDLAAEEIADPRARVALLFAPEVAPAAVLDAAESQCRKAGWLAPDRVGWEGAGADLSRLARRLQETGTRAIFLLVPHGAQAALLREAAAIGWTPNVYVAGSLAGREILDAPPEFGDRIFVAYPTSPPEAGGRGMSELNALLERHHLAAGPLLAQLSAFASAKILVDGLQRAGRDVSREKLVESLEGLFDFDTGVTPPVAFGPSRRVGVEGAWVGVVDLAQRTLRRASGRILPR